MKYFASAVVFVLAVCVTASAAAQPVPTSTNTVVAQKAPKGPPPSHGGMPPRPPKPPKK